MITFRILFIYSIIFISLFYNSPLFSQAFKGQNTRLHAIPLSKQKPDDKPGKPIIGFVSQTPLEQSSPEIRKAFDQLKKINKFDAKYITNKELEKLSGKTGKYSVLWIHTPDTLVTIPGKSSKFSNAIKTYVEQGGKLLLSLQAVHYLNVTGFEKQTFRDSLKPCNDNGYGRRLGLHSFRDHPIFSGLNGGTYLCRPVKDTTVRITGLFGDDIPLQGKVIAVDWDYIFLRESSKLALEYQPGLGKVIAVGAYMNYSMNNVNAPHLALFTENCLDYLIGKVSETPEFYWDYKPAIVSQCEPGPESDRLISAVPPAKIWTVDPSDLALKLRFGTENFWDVAGEQLVTMGSEKGGIEETWAHPFMAFRDYEVGIRFAYRDSIFWLNDERPEITVNPASFERQYKFSRAYLREIIVNDPTEPNGVIHYEYRGVYPARLIIRFKSNLRWMWPYSEKVTGSICHAWNPDIDALMIGDQSGDLNLIIGANKKPVIHLAGQYDGFSYSRSDSTFKPTPTNKIQVESLMEYNLEMNDNMDMVFSASIEGFSETYNQFTKSIHNPYGIYHRAVQHVDDLLTKSLVVTTPDTNFNTGYRWALLGTDRFFVNTPSMGKGLVAGYSTTRHGWDGGHAVNGRPGYGWYFGRDAEWSSFALLDYGDFEKVKAQLEFFNKYQDLNGKIFHEASTSGIFHYDAADATPLYIVLAGRYFRHSNDTAFLRKTWPNIKRAINFCFSTDTDQDHLIENTNVGHGWVEGGELYGSHATIYMAGSWGAALSEASTMAGFMKDYEMESYRRESDLQRNSIDQNFWNEDQHFYSYGKNKDGSYRMEQTILPAVPIYFRMTNREKSILAMKYIAGNAFTTNWGARILREDSPLFKPTGYHYGSVWPLFTGWAALAEYTTGRSVQGFSHLMNNLNIYQNWGLGFAEEVLNGTQYQPSGVCAHQCWSETMVLQPAIEGMLGLKVQAGERRITIAPQLPPHWDSLHASHIRINDQFIDFTFTRRGQSNSYHFTLNSGTPVKVEFMPVLPAGTKFFKVTLDGKEIPVTTFKSAGSMALMTSFELRDDVTLTVETENGISVIPVVYAPKPGDASEGIRIIDAKLMANKYEIEVEGKSGSSEMIHVWSYNGTLAGIKNARLVSQIGQISNIMVEFGVSESKYETKTVVIDVKD